MFLLRSGLCPLAGFALSGCVLITGPPPGDTGDTGTCASGSVLFTPTGGTATLVTDAFSAGTEAAPATYEVTEPGTLAFCDGTFYASITVSADQATLMGVKGAESTILSGADAVQVVHHTGADSITIQGLTLTAGTAEAGGALLSDHGDIEVRDSVLSESHASQRGGGLTAAEGQIEVVNSTITDNTTGNFGGAIATYTALTLTGSTISDNVSDLVGGGVYAEGAVDISSTVFDNNSARNVGGALYMGGGTLTDTEFHRNSSDISGGGLYSNGGTVDLVRPLFEDNDAAESGGAVYLSTASATCTGTVGERQGFFRNSRAVAVSIGTFSARDCDFGEGTDDNTVYDVEMIDGGGGSATFSFRDDATFDCSALSCG